MREKGEDMPHVVAPTSFRRGGYFTSIETLQTPVIQQFPFRNGYCVHAMKVMQYSLHKKSLHYIMIGNFMIDMFDYGF